MIKQLLIKNQIFVIYNLHISIIIYYYVFLNRK